MIYLISGYDTKNYISDLHGGQRVVPYIETEGIRRYVFVRLVEAENKKDAIELFKDAHAFYYNVPHEQMEIIECNTLESEKICTLIREDFDKNKAEHQ